MRRDRFTVALAALLGLWYAGFAAARVEAASNKDPFGGSPIGWSVEPNGRHTRTTSPRFACSKQSARAWAGRSIHSIKTAELSISVMKSKATKTGRGALSYS